MRIKIALLLAPMTLVSPVLAVEPYQVEIWARALFGTDGALSSVEFLDEQAQPKYFLDVLREKLSKARIAPPEINGAPATFKTGVLVTILVEQKISDARFRIIDMSPMPLLLSRKFDRFPDLVFEPGAQLTELRASCLVQLSGRCRDVKVTRPGTPYQVKEFVRNSLEMWQFEPQELNGTRIESEYRAVFNLKLQQ